MATMADRIREFRSVLLQDEGWARYLAPPPIKDRPILGHGEITMQLPSDLGRLLLRHIDPLEEVKIQELARRIGKASDSIRSEMSTMVRKGWLYAELVPGVLTSKLYGITDVGEEVARGPTKTEAEDRTLPTVRLMAAPHKPSKGPATIDHRGEAIVRLYQDGVSQRDIKQKFHISSRRLLRILNDSGVSIRSSGEQFKITNLRGEAQCHQEPRQSCTTCPSALIP